MSRNARIDYQTITADFVLGDRRIADRADITLAFQWIDNRHKEWNRIEDAVYRMEGTKPGKAITCIFTTPTTSLGVVELRAGQPLSDRESKLASLLAAFVAYSQLTIAQQRVSYFPGTIGRALTEIRESLGISQADIAHEIETTRITLSRWESGARLPGTTSIYRWCQALGIVCPSNTALIRTIEFSPDLLRFLQEDPQRLRALTPDQFERFVAERLDRQGYNVILTGATNRKDGGIDLMAVPRMANVGSVVIAGQMKPHRDRKTEREAVDRLLAWKDSYFGVGLLVTNTAFTKDAVWTAAQERNRHFLRLRDFTDLKRWVQGRFGDEKDWREIPDRIELAPGIVVEIPRPRIVSAIDFDLKGGTVPGSGKRRDPT